MSTKNRVDSLKNIPGASEVGLPNMDLYSWWAVHVPKGTPRPILDKLEGIFNKAVLDADTKKQLSDSGADRLPGDSKLARELMVAGVKQWGDYVKIAKIEPYS